MRKIVLLTAALLMGASLMFGQGAKNIMINEVLTDNTDSYLDEYGQKLPWIELVNNSFTTYDVRGMFITTDKSVLNKEMSVPERMKRMSQIPNGFDASVMEGRHHLLLFLNSQPEKGPKHLDVDVNVGQEMWIALYDGNAKNLIDSVTIPALSANCSYARIADGAGKWATKTPENVTPDANNVTRQELSKLERWKESDPHGFLMAIIAMGIVFSALVLLYIFMKVFGKINHDVEVGHERKERFKQLKKLHKASQKAIIMAKDGYQSKGISKETYMAVIAMALSEYAQDVHDLESGIITIKPKQTAWNTRVWDK